MKNDFYKRLALTEAYVNAQNTNNLEFLQMAYERACVEKNEEEAASLARSIRNKLLEISDKEMVFDRLEVNTTSATKFIASLANILSGSWAVYRQALRDLPEQDGFPFNVVFPVSPNV